MSFADHIYQFALTTNVVSRDSFIRLLTTVNNYATEALAIEYTRLLVPHHVTGHPGLNRLNLETLQAESSHRIKTDRGRYYGQVAYAFDTGTPLWVVSSKQDQPLAEAKRYVDGWSGVAKLPRYQPMFGLDGKHEARTSIIVPIRHNDRTVGVLNCETHEFVEPTANSRQEFARLADAIAILMHLVNVDEQSSIQTEEAIQNLETRLHEQPKITCPGIFVAYSERAEREVIDAISNVLGGFTSVMEPMLWQHMQEPGNIIAQLLDVMAKCDYGICYLSEPTRQATAESGSTAPTTAHAYTDNPNVLFEAGIFKGRTHASGRSVLIPIREESSPELPFDLRHERVLNVARTRAGKLSAGTFERSLHSTISAMIGR